VFHKRPQLVVFTFQDSGRTQRLDIVPCIRMTVRQKEFCSRTNAGKTPNLHPKSVPVHDRDTVFFLIWIGFIHKRGGIVSTERHEITKAICRVQESIVQERPVNQVPLHKDLFLGTQAAHLAIQSFGTRNGTRIYRHQGFRLELCLRVNRLTVFPRRNQKGTCGRQNHFGVLGLFRNRRRKRKRPEPVPYPRGFFSVFESLHSLRFLDLFESSLVEVSFFL